MACLGDARAAVVAIGIAGAVLGSAAQKAAANDPPRTSLTRLAALNDSFTSSPGRQHAPALRREDIWRLVQGAEGGKSDAAANDGTVLAIFALSAPEGAEEDVARQYGLELVEQTNLGSLGMRLARYRVPNGTLMVTVVERLRADQRISEAQANLVHAAPAPIVPRPAISSAPKPTAGPTQALRQDKPSAPRGRVVNHTAAPQGAPIRAARATEPARSGRASDVLAGGL
jgi:hypothetical protein